MRIAGPVKVHMRPNFKEPEYRTIVVDGEEVRQKKCQSECKKWRAEDEFHFRTPERKTRSSRCRFCAAKAQRDLRLRKKGQAPKKPKGKYGIDLPDLPSGFSRTKTRKAS